MLQQPAQPLAAGDRPFGKFFRRLLLAEAAQPCIANALVKGTYQLPDEASLEERQAVEVTRSQLSLILDGIDLSSARQRMRFRPQRELSKRDAAIAG